LEGSTVRILVVDDFEPWRRFTRSTLQKHAEMQIIGEAADGLEAVQKAELLQPDLILLDIGLPRLNGIQAARRINQLSPKSKILFVSEDLSWDVAKAALGTTALGYVVKLGAARELLPAVRAVLQGKRFVSGSLVAQGLGEPTHPRTDEHHNANNVVEKSHPEKVATIGHHKAGFYSDERFLLEDITQFIGAALKVGNSAIAVATKSRREELLPKLQALGLDIGAAIEQDRYIALDAAEAISKSIHEGILDGVRFMSCFGDLIRKAAKNATGERPRVVVYGEGAYLLWAQGNPGATINDEKLCNRLVETYDVDMLCGYLVESGQGAMDDNLFQQICAEHSSVSSR
jgi:DNA-binding NarL/FixJ family response regulator